MSRPFRIGVVGTFDIANFGDLLFPLLARHQLELRLGSIDLVPYSYRELEADSWPYAVRGVDRLPKEAGELDLLVVGGGDLVRFDAEVAPGYGPTTAGVHHPTGYWLMPTVAAAAAGVPVAWNALGVVGDPPAEARKLLEAAVRAADYVSVRDAASLVCLGAAGLEVGRIVPDSAFGISALIGGQSDGEARRLLAEVGVNDAYVVVQPSPHLTPFSHAIKEATVEAARAGVACLELPISPVHGDRHNALDLGNQVHRLLEWPSPLVLATIIAGAQAVIAQSLHLSIVAIATGVPVFRRPTHPESKYALLEPFAGVHFWDTGEELADLVARRLGRTGLDAVVAERLGQLSAHWDTIAALAGKGLATKPDIVTGLATVAAEAASTLHTERCERERELTAQKQELTAQERVTACAEASVEELERTIASGEQERETARAMLEVSEARLEQIVTSRIWRYTRPLRSSVSRLRRARRRVPVLQGAASSTTGLTASHRHPALASALLASEKTRPLVLDIRDMESRRVNLLVPTVSFEYFFAGYIGKFNLALRLSELGFNVRVVILDECDFDPEAWRPSLTQFGLEDVLDQVEFAYAYDRVPLAVGPRDAFVATTWWTAHVAHDAARQLGRDRFLYLIQEYEPMTFPMGAMAALAEETYTFLHDAVFSTELLRDYFRSESLGVYAPGAGGDEHCVAFENAIVNVGSVSSESIAARRPSRLLFYARPEEHAARNMFELGALALADAASEGLFSGWELTGVGTVGDSSVLDLGNGARLRLIPRTTPADYIALLRRHDLGLSLMYTPHPSLVPIEMASAGMIVVTNTFANKTAEKLAAISSNLIAVPPTRTGVVQGLRDALGRTGDADARAQGARVHWSRSWRDSFDSEVCAALGRFLSDA